MEESQFGFSYNWSDLKPVRALAVTVVSAQAIGAVLGLLFFHHSSWIKDIWLGVAILMFPAFLVGLVLQSRIRPGSIGENKVMVRRLGMICMMLTLIAVFFLLFGFK